MMLVGLLLLYLAIRRRVEPLLLLPIGFGALLVNIPGGNLGAAPIYDALGNMQESGGILYYLHHFGIKTGIFPLLIFMGVGALTDFGPMLARPRTLLLGAAAQFGIFAAVLGTAGLSLLQIPVGGGETLDFTIAQAAAVGIIGGADGPTAIYVSGKLAPELLGAVAVAAYSYMALIPLIQPPIMRLLTTARERRIVMTQLHSVSQREKILFPLLLLLLVGLLVPSAAPLIGMFCLGNLLRECGVAERLFETARNALINVVTLLLGLAVGSQMSAAVFLQPRTLGILLLGILAFVIGTASGILMAKLMNIFSKDPINPLIGAAGVSAVPMAARVANREGQRANPKNYLLMHAMGPNVAGVIGSAIAAGIMIDMVRTFLSAGT